MKEILINFFQSSSAVYMEGLDLGLYEVYALFLYNFNMNKKEKNNVNEDIKNILNKDFSIFEIKNEILKDKNFSKNLDEIRSLDPSIKNIEYFNKYLTLANEKMLNKEIEKLLEKKSDHILRKKILKLTSSLNKYLLLISGISFSEKSMFTSYDKYYKGLDKLDELKSKEMGFKNYDDLRTKSLQLFLFRNLVNKSSENVNNESSKIDIEKVKDIQFYTT